jgi:hypothetical protein
MVNILDTLSQKQGDQYKSNSWYRNAIDSISSRITASKLMSAGVLTSRPSIGLLNLFFYDPKTKVKLPYYDTFPLVLPLEVIPKGFAGLNFHYLPPGLRLRLLENMTVWATQGDLTKAKLDVSWNRVKNIPMTNVTIKKYLWSQVRSSFLKITLDQAAIACYLPVQQFKKKSDSYVWAQARKF